MRVRSSRILYGWKEGADHYWCGARDQGDVWFFDKPVRNDLHPTMKPVALVERAIRNSSKTRDIVLDPFGGSGSTLIACEKTGRQARLIELDPKYIDTIILRWQDWTGEVATLDGDGGATKRSPPGGGLCPDGDLRSATELRRLVNLFGLTRLPIDFIPNDLLGDLGQVLGQRFVDLDELGPKDLIQKTLWRCKHDRRAPLPPIPARP